MATPTTTPTASAIKPASFMTIGADVRLKIYIHLFPAPINMPKNMFQIPAIAATSRELREEVLTAWFNSDNHHPGSLWVVVPTVKEMSFWHLYDRFQAKLAGVKELIVYVGEEDPEDWCKEEHENEEQQEQCEGKHFDGELPPVYERAREVEKALARDCKDLKGITEEWDFSGSFYHSFAGQL